MEPFQYAEYQQVDGIKLSSTANNSIIYSSILANQITELQGSIQKKEEEKYYSH